MRNGWLACGGGGGYRPAPSWGSLMDNALTALAPCSDLRLGLVGLLACSAGLFCWPVPLALLPAKPTRQLSRLVRSTSSAKDVIPHRNGFAKQLGETARVVLGKRSILPDSASGPTRSWSPSCQTSGSASAGSGRTGNAAMVKRDSRAGPTCTPVGCRPQLLCSAGSCLRTEVAPRLGIPVGDDRHLGAWSGCTA